jgi:hypothetical protein
MASEEEVPVPLSRLRELEAKASKYDAQCNVAAARARRYYHSKATQDPTFVPSHTERLRSKYWGDQEYREKVKQGRRERYKAAKYDQSTPDPISATVPPHVRSTVRDSPPSMEHQPRE